MNTIVRAVIPGMLGLASGPILAAEPLGVYIGGAAGRANVEATWPFGQISEHHSAFKVMVGIRPIRLAGGEVEYFDLGHPTRSVTITGYTVPVADVSMKGEAAFGVLYLPVRIFDVYAKAGVARTRSKEHAFIVCATFAAPCDGDEDRTDTGFAIGGGAQVRLGPFALRGEYERFNAACEHPSLWVIGATWTLF